MTICAKIVPVVVLPASSRQGIYLVRKPNEQAIKQKIVALYDQVFIQQSSLELEVRLHFLWTPCSIEYRHFMHNHV